MSVAFTSVWLLS